MPPDRDPADLPPAQVTALILCGGQSRRMGRDKAQLELSGRTLLQRALSVVEGLTGQVVLACGSEPRYEDLGLPLVLDAEPDGGPLLGLRAGLEALETEWLLAIACDMPALNQGLFAPLFAAAAEPDVDLVHYAGEDGNEPLCALYRRTVLPAVQASLQAGRRRMDAFWSGLRKDGNPLVRRVLAKDPAWVEGANPFLNLNTPDDWARMRGTAATAEEGS